MQPDINFIANHVKEFHIDFVETLNREAMKYFSNSQH